MHRSKHCWACILMLTVPTACLSAQWYPGIIHLHTQFSDGNESPAELAQIVQTELKKCRRDGKGFMIVTDHYDGISGKGTEAYSVYPSAVRKTSVDGQFVAIPGLELGSKWRPEADTVADSNMLAIGSLSSNYTKFDACYDRNTGTGLPLLEKFDYQQQVINQILALGMVPVAAHPTQLFIGGTTVARRDNRFDMQSGHDGLRGVELFNVLGLDPEKQNDEAVDFYLRLTGQPAFVTSGSDYHGAEELLTDSLSRVTWVYAEALTEEAILNGVSEGRTYAARDGASLRFGIDWDPVPTRRVQMVDVVMLRLSASATGDRVRFVIYRDGQGIDRQAIGGAGGVIRGFYLHRATEAGWPSGCCLNPGGKEVQVWGWTDPRADFQEHSYVVRVDRSLNGQESTVAVTSPIRLRVRPPGYDGDAFFKAVADRDIAAVRRILDVDPSLAIAGGLRRIGRDNSGLFIAAYNGYLDVAELLLARGANVNVGQIATTPISVAAMKGHQDVVELLLQHGAKIDDCSGGRTLLLRAVRTEHAELAKWLVQHGADVNIPDEEQHTPLWHARQSGQEDVVDLLVAKGAHE